MTHKSKPVVVLLGYTDNTVRTNGLDVFMAFVDNNTNSNNTLIL